MRQMAVYKTTIATPDEFLRLRPIWNELVLRMDFPVVFLTWEWISTWWEYFGHPKRELIILIVSDGGTVIGILPLYAERMVLANYWLNGRVLSYCGSTDLFPDHLDVITAPERARECFRSIKHFLFTQYRTWDVVRIPMVSSSSRLPEWMVDDTANSRAPDFDVEPASIAHYIPITGTFDEYLGRFDAKQRYNLRSRAKKLYRDSGIRYVNCDDDAECLRQLFTLHRQRAERKGITSSFVDARIHAFHEALAPRIRGHGWLSLRTLRTEKEVIAASYNLVLGERIFSYQKGFDPAWERYGPGSVLIYELIREAFESRRLEYNFLQGDEEYKRVWTPEYRTLSNLHIYNTSVLGRITRNSYRVKRVVKRRLGAWRTRTRALPSSEARAVVSGDSTVSEDLPEASYAVEVAGLDTLRTVQKEWNNLVTSMRYPTVFSSWDWVSTWWEHFGSGRELRLVMVRRDGALKAVLPLYSETRVFGSHGRLGRVLRLCGAADLYPDPLDIISAEADASDCVRAVLKHLTTSVIGWDVLHLQFLTEDSALLRGVTSASGGNFLMEEISTSPYIPIVDTYDTYFRSLSANERAKISRCRRKLIVGQGVEYVQYGPGDAQHVLRALTDLHKRRAAEKNIRSSFAANDVTAFHRTLLERVDPRQIWMRCLRRGEEIIAAFYGYAVNGRVCYYQLGYNPAWGPFSPGVVLLHETIREAFASGYSEYNFLQGDEDYKARWAGQARRLYAVDLFNGSLLGGLSRNTTAIRRLLKSRLTRKGKR